MHDILSSEIEQTYLSSSVKIKFTAIELYNAEILLENEAGNEAATRFIRSADVFVNS